MADGARLRHLCRIVAAASVGWRECLQPWYATALADGVEPGALQEATLQVFLFAGYPRAIDAFEELARALGDEAPRPPGDDAEDADFFERGHRVFRRVYGKHAEAVRAHLEGLHPDFARFVLRDAYGQVLGRPALPLAERELLAVAMLAALGLRGQLRAHVRGALRAGLGADDVRLALRAAEEAAGPLPQAGAILEKTLAKHAG